MDALSIRDLKKTYKSGLEALKGISLDVREGEFFGETALLYDIPRKATIRTVTRCRLLVLDRNDFTELIESDGDLREAILKVAEQRLTEYEKSAGAG